LIFFVSSIAVERASSRTTVGAANCAAVSAGSAENPRPHEHNRFCRVQELEASVLVIASQTFDDDKLTGAHHLVSSRKTQHYSSLRGRGCKLINREVDLLVSVVIVACSTPCAILPAKLTFRSYYFHRFAIRAVGESVSLREVCLY
jgi:hypothetical protein